MSSSRAPMGAYKNKTCAFPGCDQPAFARWLCNGHYRQRYVEKRKQLRPLIKRQPNEVIHDGVSWCIVLVRRSGQTFHARVNKTDLPRVRRHRWTYFDGYAVTSQTHRGKRRLVLLHRFILDAPVGRQVDHRNGDGLDCRRRNMRLVPLEGNAQNVVKKSATGHRNVYMYRGKHRVTYHVRAGSKSKRLYGGSFASLGEAIKAARALRAKLFLYVNEDRH